MMRTIDKGLANSPVGLVLVTPSFLAKLGKESVSEKELSALLAGNQLVPIVHGTTYAALREVSPLRVAHWPRYSGRFDAHHCGKDC
jgi:hypothetical protein